ncbi:MAG TPA: hypothetical protein VLE27_07670, partial [Thermoanaerobaculia bacterium]|nr:hypothetical protein [Thermoanaerobaculia bacterium]
KRSAEGLRTALNKFIDDLEHRPRLTEEDIKEVVADLTSQMNRQESYLRYLTEARASLLVLLQGPFEPDLKQQVVVPELLEMIDRRFSAHREMFVILDLGIHRLLVLRDKVLVLEGEEMSSPSFWGDDEP